MSKYRTDPRNHTKLHEIGRLYFVVLRVISWIVPFFPTVSLYPLTLKLSRLDIFAVDLFSARSESDLQDRDDGGRDIGRTETRILSGEAGASSGD